MKTASIQAEQKQAVTTAPQSPKTTKKYNVFTFPKTRHKITVEDVQAMAELVSMRLTEKEAAIHLGISPESWTQWKARHRGQNGFEDVLSRVRTKKITGLIKGIERHGVGADGLRADWRALDRVLVITDQRYSDRAPATVEADSAAIADDLLAKMIARAYNVSTERAALPAPKDDPEKTAEVVEIQAVETKEGE